MPRHAYNDPSITVIIAAREANLAGFIFSPTHWVCSRLRLFFFPSQSAAYARCNYDHVIWMRILMIRWTRFSHPPYITLASFIFTSDGSSWNPRESNFTSALPLPTKVVDPALIQPSIGFIYVLRALYRRNNHNPRSIGETGCKSLAIVVRTITRGIKKMKKKWKKKKSIIRTRV